MTNAEYIRDIDDTQLAIFFDNDFPYCNEICEDFQDDRARKCRHQQAYLRYLEWIKKDIGESWK